MATDNAKRVEEKLKAEARKIDDKIRERAHWSPQGRAYIDMRDKNLFKYLGFKTIIDWAEDVSVGRATLFEVIRCHEGYNELHEDDRRKITRQKAVILLRLPKEERLAKEWIHRAQDRKLSAGALEALVEKRASKPGGKTAVAEKRVFLKIKGYKSQIEFIKETIAEWAKNLNFGDDEAKALEAMCAEARSTANDDFKVATRNILSSVAMYWNAKLDITKQIRELESGSLSAEQQLEQVYKLVAADLDATNTMRKGFGDQLVLEGWVAEKKTEAKKLAKAARKSS